LLSKGKMDVLSTVNSKTNRQDHSNQNKRRKSREHPRDLRQSGEPTYKLGVRIQRRGQRVDYTGKGRGEKMKGRAISEKKKLGIKNRCEGNIPICTSESEKTRIYLKNKGRGKNNGSGARESKRETGIHVTGCMKKSGTRSEVAWGQPPRNTQKPTPRALLWGNWLSSKNGKGRLR